MIFFKIIKFYLCVSVCVSLDVWPVCAGVCGSQEKAPDSSKLVMVIVSHPTQGTRSKLRTPGRGASALNL